MSIASWFHNDWAWLESKGKILITDAKEEIERIWKNDAAKVGKQLEALAVAAVTSAVSVKGTNAQKESAAIDNLKSGLITIGENEAVSVGDQLSASSLGTLIKIAFKNTVSSDPVLSTENKANTLRAAPAA